MAKVIYGKVVTAKCQYYLMLCLIVRIDTSHMLQQITASTYEMHPYFSSKNTNMQP